MQIKINTPTTFGGKDKWEPYRHAVIFVQSLSDIDKLWQELCKQDEDWKHQKNLIKVAPSEIYATTDLDKYCEQAGGAKIHDISKIKSTVDFLIYHTLFPVDKTTRAYSSTHEVIGF